MMFNRKGPKEETMKESILSALSNFNENFCYLNGLDRAKSNLLNEMFRNIIVIFCAKRIFI